MFITGKKSILLNKFKKFWAKSNIRFWSDLQGQDVNRLIRKEFTVKILNFRDIVLKSMNE